MLVAKSRGKISPISGEDMSRKIVHFAIKLCCNYFITFDDQRGHKFSIVLTGFFFTALDAAIGSQIHASHSGRQPITRHLPLNKQLSLTSSWVLLTCRSC